LNKKRVQKEKAFLLPYKCPGLAYNDKIFYIFFSLIMRNINRVIGGDLPEGSSIDLVSGTKGYDIEIRYYRESRLQKLSLSEKVSDMRIIRTENSDGSLSPLESGIIGGSVASTPGFLGAYLTAKEPDAVIFLCNLKDGRHFYGYCSLPFYEKMAAVLLPKNKQRGGGCMVILLMPALFLCKKIF
jgi:hypothetical protein